MPPTPDPQGYPLFELTNQKGQNVFQVNSDGMVWSNSGIGGMSFRAPVSAVGATQQSILFTTPGGTSILLLQVTGTPLNEYTYFWLGANAGAPTASNYSFFHDTTDVGIQFADLILNANNGQISLNVDGGVRLEIGTRTSQRLNVPGGYGSAVDTLAVINASQRAAVITLANSQMYFWLDEVGNNLKVQVKYSSGTTKTATIALV